MTLADERGEAIQPHLFPGSLFQMDFALLNSDMGVSPSHGFEAKSCAVNTITYLLLEKQDYTGSRWYKRRQRIQTLARHAGDSVY